MALRFYGIVPGNPGGACPAVFREELSGDFLMQGKNVSPADGIVRLPGSMIDIIRSACHDALGNELTGTAGGRDGMIGTARVWREEGTGDFLMQGEPVTDPAALARVEADSPILDDESVVRLPARMAVTILEVCGDLVR